MAGSSDTDATSMEQPCENQAQFRVRLRSQSMTMGIAEHGVTTYRSGMKGWISSIVVVTCDDNDQINRS